MKLPLTLALAIAGSNGMAQVYSKQDLHRLYAETCKRYKHKWSAGESVAFVRITMKESSGNPGMQNSRSTSAGLFGFLRGTRNSYKVKLSDPHPKQANAFILYCKRRYGSLQKALDHHRRAGWY